jgi:hypothetical protein
LERQQLALLGHGVMSALSPLAKADVAKAIAAVVKTINNRLEAI